ncbi:MAG: hypothetical protein QOI59_2453 [Gammaproteobacteria bacterium]|jgi:hypothetical protein|nr:hypothetical protein [Gammaproteobacteria bacterium]
MNRLLFAGLVIAIISVCAYVVAALRYRQKPELADGIAVFVAVVSVLGAIRIIGFALTEQFEKIVLETQGNSWWSLSSEDSVFIVIGGIALAWASIQAIWESFARVCAITPGVASE